MKVKRGASIQGCRAEILKAAIGIEPLFANQGVELVITSGTEDYKHGAKRSTHYRGDAIDVRSKTVPDKGKLTKALKTKLGSDFYVVLESEGKPYEHYHIQYSPIYKEME